MQSVPLSCMGDDLPRPGVAYCSECKKAHLYSYTYAKNGANIANSSLYMYLEIC